MKSFLLSIALIVTVFGRTQEFDINYVIPFQLQDHIEFNPLPSEGEFITIQVAYANNYSWIRDDDELLSTFIILKPVYVKYNKESKSGNICLGLFNDYTVASQILHQIKCFYPKTGPFLTAYKNGERVPISEFYEGNVKEKVPKLKKEFKKLDKMVGENYFRIQIGYYEEPGYNANEQEKMRILEENGIELMEENYKNGRLLLTKKKYKTWDDAKSMESRVDDLIQHLDQGFCVVKRYYTNQKLPDYILVYLQQYNQCLKN